jgi:hypothetical protein
MALTPGDVPACGRSFARPPGGVKKNEESDFEDTARLFKELGRA